MKGILLDGVNDLIINPVRENGKITGGLTIGNSDYQNARLVIVAQKGEFKEIPTVGFCIDSYLRATGDVKQLFVNRLEIELKSIGYTNATVRLGNSILDFDINI